MNNYVIICVVIGVMSSALVADSLRIETFFMRAAQHPCPANFTGMIPNPEDCHSFYICDAGIPGLIPCPAGLCFNPEGVEGGACDHCEVVPGCESATGVPSSSAPSTPSTPGSSSESPEPSSTTTQSPPDTSTPPTETTTVSTTSAPSSTTTQKTTTSSGEDLTCPPDVPYIYMAYPGDCNKFYYCQNGVNTGVYNCGAGLWFNFRQQVCAVPWGASCES